MEFFNGQSHNLYRGKSLIAKYRKSLEQSPLDKLTVNS
jgi:hypothetical protein